MALSLNAINAAIYDNLPFNFIRDTIFERRRAPDYSCD
jgi:hypothetical protein